MIEASIPSLPISVIPLGPLKIHFYALFILTGIGVAYRWSTKRWVERGGNPDDMFDVCFVAVFAGIIGARAYHVLVNFPEYFGSGADKLSAFRMWEGGLGIWGAVVGGGIAAWFMARKKNIAFLTLADTIAPTLFVAQAIGRLGNWANQELYGGPSSAPWAVDITCHVNGEVIAGCVPGTYQPTFLYEALWNLAACAVVVVISRKLSMGGGRVFLMYVVGYSVGRIIMETMRTEPSTMVLGMRIHMLIYIVTAVVALAALVWRSQPTYVEHETRRAHEGREDHVVPVTVH